MGVSTLIELYILYNWHVLWQGYVTNSMLFMNNSFWLLGLVSLYTAKNSELHQTGLQIMNSLPFFGKSSTLASMLHSIWNSSMIMRYWKYNYYPVTSNLILHYSPNRSGAWRWAFFVDRERRRWKTILHWGKIVELVLACVCCIFTNFNHHCSLC